MISDQHKSSSKPFELFKRHSTKRCYFDTALPYLLSEACSLVEGQRTAGEGGQIFQSLPSPGPALTDCRCYSAATCSLCRSIYERMGIRPAMTIGEHTLCMRWENVRQKSVCCPELEVRRLELKHLAVFQADLPPEPLQGAQIEQVDLCTPACTAIPLPLLACTLIFTKNGTHL